jgi:hypothetical protein
MRNDSNKYNITHRHSLFQCCAIIIVCLFLAAFAPLAMAAKSLAEYKENIQTSRKFVIELQSSFEEDVPNKYYPEFQRQALKDIRAKLPASEKIEWQGAEVETNNRWLIEKLNEFEREPQNSSKRTTILNEISERLSAIEQKIDELEKASASSRSKDEDKQKLAEILRREEYQNSKGNQESFFYKLYRQFMEWLQSIAPRPNIPTASGEGFGSLSFILQIILYVAVLGIIAFLLRRFLPLFVKKFQSREKKKKEDRIILGERLAENENAQNLFGEAENLARAGNVRGAIRKGYIALLCELSDRKIIGLARHKTNRDYLRDVLKREELYQNMSNLTLDFERHWYGFEAASEKDWEEFRNEYRKVVGNR